MVGQASVAPEPLSPLHATHVSVGPQTGVLPVHPVVFVVVHWTHVLVVVLHAGVGALQFASVAGPSVEPSGSLNVSVWQMNGV